MSRRVSGAVLFLFLAVAACGLGGDGAGGDGGSQARDLGEITVFAASSLTESFEKLGVRLERRRPGTDVRFSFASSSDLAVQITEGAPADVFASADPLQMEIVADAGRAIGPVRFATNRLVVLVPQDNPAGIEQPNDLARPGRKLVLAAPEVPAGNYAREGFRKLGIAGEVEANVVSNEEDVKAVVTKVALGEADAGVTYVTDVTGEVAGKVRSVEFPARANVTARYAITELAEAPNPRGGRAFVSLVTSREGQRLLREHGFGPP